MPRLALPILAVSLAAGLAFSPATFAVAPQGVATNWRDALVINSALAHPRKMFEAFDTASLNLYDFNGDGQLEIVSNNDNNRAYVIDSRTGGVLVELPTSHPGGETWPVRDINPIAIGNLMGDGVPCMVVPSDAARLTAWCCNAALSTPTSFNFPKTWDVSIDAALDEPNFKASHPWLYGANGKLGSQYHVGSDGAAYMASVDASGCKYVFAETDGYPGQLAFDCHGNYKWSVSWYDGNAGVHVAEFNKDGTKDACFASDAGELSCYNAKTGAISWTFRAQKHGAYPASLPVAPVFADIFGNGKLYTFFGARNAVHSDGSPEPPSSKDPAYDAQWINKTHAVWFLVDPNGQMVWNVSFDWMNPLQYDHPAAFDINGDGVLDFIALDWNTIGHKPGDWETTNRSSNLFALDGRTGGVLWHTGVPIYWSNKDFVLADADGDGKPGVIIEEPRLGLDGLGALYGDGRLELVVPAAHGAPGSNYRSLDVGWREGELHVVSTGLRYNVAFSANSQLSDDQKETQLHGTGGGTPPPATPTPTPTATPAPTTPTVTTSTPPTATTPSPTPNASSTPPTKSTPTTTATTTTPASPPVASTLSPSTTTTTTTSTPPLPAEAVSPTRVPAPGIIEVAFAVGAAVLIHRRR